MKQLVEKLLLLIYEAPHDLRVSALQAVMNTRKKFSKILGCSEQELLYIFFIG